MGNPLKSFFNKIKSTPRQPIPARRIHIRSGGTVVTEDTAMKVSAFYRGVTYISTQIAKLPFNIKDSNNELISGAIYNLLNLRPNNEMNSFHFKSLLTQQALINGNGYAEIERDTVGRPVALWPLRSTDVDVARDSKGKLWYRIIGGSLVSSGEDAYLDPRDMLHVKNFYTKDGLVAQGVAGYASEVLGISLGADSFANSLYSNGAMPSGVLKVPGSLSDGAFARMKEDWHANHGGRQVGGTAILEEGVEYSSITLSPEVLQFLETRKFTVLEIARFLGLPLTKLFDGDSATYNNIEHANLEVAVDTLDAWAKNWEIEVDVKILNNRSGGRKSEMDLYAIFRGDMKTRADYFKSRMATGSITPNQIRVLEGDAPYEGGDRYFIATNNYTPVDRMDEALDSQFKNNSGNTKTEDEKELDETVKNYLKKKI